MMTTLNPPAASPSDIADSIPEAARRTGDFAKQAAFPQSFFDLVQENVVSSFELAQQIIRAKTLAEVVALQMAYWQKQFWLPLKTRQLAGRSAGMEFGSAPASEARLGFSDAKGVSDMNKDLKKQKANVKKSVALAQSKVYRKASGELSARPRVKTKKTSSGRVPKQRLKRKK
jgi:Phasin protein